MEFHFEHHIFPTIPYRGLKTLHRRLQDQGVFDRHRELLSDGYVLFLSRAIAGKFRALQQG
jgi:fatty acid desaturase